MENRKRKYGADAAKFSTVPKKWIMGSLQKITETFKMRNQIFSLQLCLCIYFIVMYISREIVSGFQLHLQWTIRHSIYWYLAPSDMWRGRKYHVAVKMPPIANFSCVYCISILIETTLAVIRVAHFVITKSALSKEPICTESKTQLISRQLWNLL